MHDVTQSTFASQGKSCTAPISHERRWVDHTSGQLIVVGIEHKANMMDFMKFTCDQSWIAEFAGHITHETITLRWQISVWISAWILASKSTNSVYCVHYYHASEYLNMISGLLTSSIESALFVVQNALIKYIRKTEWSTETWTGS